MAEKDSDRPPAEAFHTVSDAEQAKLLSNRESFKFFEPFVARELTATAAAKEVGCALDTMLYRIKTFLKAGLLQVSRLEKRPGRPIKHYRSVHDAYFIPFELTPYTELEERMREYHRSQEAVIVPATAKLLRESGLEGYEFYRHTESGTVWGNSASRTGEISDLLKLFLNPYDVQVVESYQGPLGGDFNSTLHLTDSEAKTLMLKLFELRNDLETREPAAGRKPYFLSLTFLPLEP